VREQGGVDLLLIDTHGLGYDAVRELLERWGSPQEVGGALLRERAGIVVRSAPTLSPAAAQEDYPGLKEGRAGHALTHSLSPPPSLSHTHSLSLSL